MIYKNNEQDLSRTTNANNAKLCVLAVVKGCQAGLVYFAVERSPDSSSCSTYKCTTWVRGLTSIDTVVNIEPCDIP